MAVLNPYVDNRTYYQPSSTPRAGCPVQLTRCYSQPIEIPGARRTRDHYYTAMKLADMVEETPIRLLNLDKVHHDMETESLSLYGSGASNIVVAKLSFDCSIEIGETSERATFVWDLKIPEVGDILSFDFIKGKYNEYGIDPYKLLKYYYSLGKSIVNKDKNKHGHTPGYSSGESSQDQYIRHTEQMLVAYLALPDAAAMIRNYLRTEIRSKYHKQSTAARIYHMGIHMHSTKTCCAPCEYTLIGLMNDDGEFHESFGFKKNFSEECLEPNELLKFKFSRKFPLKVLVTVTANTPDADHKKKPEYRETDATDDEIFVRDQATLSKIFTTFLDNPYDVRKVPEETALKDRTVFTSGSNVTPGTKKTIAKANRVKSAEDKRSYEIEKMHLGYASEPTKRKEKERAKSPPTSPTSERLAKEKEDRDLEKKLKELRMKG
ncbi:MAG: hypothetical protein H7A38_04075 [Chlamydiales bacterium]|nr:hypothetical protein [Chlamydiales bacterium]